MSRLSQATSPTPRALGIHWTSAAGLTLALCGCQATRLASPGCGKDVDCKGERICSEGSCIDPPMEPEPEPAAEPEAPETPTPRTWYRGGPGHAGASAATGPTEEPSPLWIAELGAVVFATPALAEGPAGLTAYVGTHAGRFVGVVVSGDEAGQVSDLDLDLGGRIWATAAATGEGEDLRLYIGSDTDELFALTPAAAGDDPEAKIAWRKKLGDCQNTRSPGPEGARCDVDGGPTIGPSGDLFVGSDGVYRLSPAGEIRWHWPAESEEPRKHVFSTPVVTEDGRVYFGGQDGFITALSAETGEQLWQHTVRADVDGSGVIGPDRGLFIGADDGRIYALRSDGSLRWSFIAQRDVRSSLAISPDHTIYVTSYDTHVYSLEPSGEVNWTLPTGAPIHASPVVDANGTIYVGSQDDHLYAISPAGKVLWALDLGADIDSSVALTDEGVVVVGCDDGSLRAFGS